MQTASQSPVKGNVGGAVFIGLPHGMPRHTKSVFYAKIQAILAFFYSD